MDGELRHLLFAAGVVCLCALAAGLWFCVGLTEVLHVGACEGLLRFAARVGYTVGSLARPVAP